MTTPAPVLQLAGISKRFGDLIANADISLELRRGELLALLGENGAGKTTLMNILFGHYVADSGTVRVFGREIPPGRPRAAIEAGVGMVHQHFALAANLTVLDNVIAGTESLAKVSADRRAAGSRLMQLAERFGLVVAPGARVRDLSVGERQRVEILKALYRNAHIVILDEPTAVLTTIEAETLFRTLRAMAEQGLSIIFITHKLHEVMSAADRVLVLRAGRVVAERATAATSRDELAELMVGRRVVRPVRRPQPPGESVMRADGVDVDIDGRRHLHSISFDVRSGETLGIIGVAGNGQTHLGRMASGLVAPTAGTFDVLGEPVTTTAPRRFVDAGIGRVPEDRHAEGVVGEMAIWENTVLERLRRRQFCASGFVRRRAGRHFAADIIDRFDVRGGRPDSRTNLLSGGNMQKLILGRNLIGRPPILVAVQPTRGLDEGAIAFVHGEILAARAAGTGILLLSEDLDEVLALSDRIQAIVKGRLSVPIAASEADAQRIGLMMAGVWEDSG